MQKKSLISPRYMSLSKLKDWKKKHWKNKTIKIIWDECDTEDVLGWDGMDGYHSSTFNIFSSKQKFWSNFNLVLFGKGREIHRTTLTNPCHNFKLTRAGAWRSWWKKSLHNLASTVLLLLRTKELANWQFMVKIYLIAKHLL